MRSFIVFFVVLGLIGAGVIAAASEYGGEVVDLTTTDAEGVDHHTSLWIVEDQGSQWLRAGSIDSAWYVRLRDNPEVRLHRGGQDGTYRAFPAPQQTDRINLLMSRDYGYADKLVGLFRDDTKSMAVRLDPIEPTPF